MLSILNNFNTAQANTFACVGLCYTAMRRKEVAIKKLPTVQSVDSNHGLHHASFSKQIVGIILMNFSTIMLNLF